MLDALGFMLPVAIAAIALSLPEVVVMILLIEPGKSRANAWGFAGGLVGSFIVVSGIALVAADALDLDRPDGRSNWVAILLLIIGSALIWFGVHKLRSRPDPDSPIEQSAILRAAANLTPTKAASLGAVMGGINPGFMALILSLVAELALTDASRTEKSLVMLMFTVVASAGIVGPLLAVQISGERANRFLEGVRQTLDDWMWLITAVVCFYFGVVLIGEALRALT